VSAVTEEKKDDAKAASGRKAAAAKPAKAAKPASAKASSSKPAAASSAPSQPASEEQKARSLAAKLAARKAERTVKVQAKGPAAAVKDKVKPRTSVHFYRPKTLRLHRNPKYQRAALVRRNKLDAYAVLKHPLCTESAMKQIEDHNTLTFIVDLKANKRHIAQAVHALYDINVVKVNTLIRPDGQKKAYVRLSPDHEALEVANTIGII
jgi:large subunit ribosomal protein L23Ae